MKMLIAVLCTCFAFANAQAQNTQIIYLSQEEKSFLNMMKQFRAQLNLPELQMHVYLQNAAKKHSEWQASRDFLTHYGPVSNKTPFQRMEEEGYVNYSYAGENIACGFADATNTFRQWAFSPQHLANMINPHYRHMGISRAGTGNETCPFYWTNDFGSFSRPNQDPADVTDINLIARAVEAVSGPLNGREVRLPSDQSSQVGSANTPNVPTAPAPTPLPNANDDASNVILNPAPEASLLQCMVPYRLGKGLLTYYQNTDTIIEAVRNQNGGYSLKLSYLQNGESANIAPVYLSGASILKNPNFPLYLIFSAPTPRLGGFTIQFNTQTSQAQFDPYLGSNGGTAGTILCSAKLTK